MIKKLILFIAALTITVSAMARIYVYEANDGTRYYTEGMPLGLTKAEKQANWTKLYRKEVDTLTPVTLSNREAVKAIFRADNEPDPITCPDGQHLNAAGDGCDDDVIVTPPHHGNLPAVDANQEITPAIGSGTKNIVTAEESTGNDPEGGSFRFPCAVSHMGRIDPIVSPNETSAHHHTLFGNTDTSPSSTPESIRTTGNSTCAGGIANRSAYWVPTMVDTATDTPLKPKEIGLYYKTETPQHVQKLPKNLRMIAKPHTAGYTTRYQCTSPSGDSDYNWDDDKIVQCQVGQNMRYSLEFPNCWDGQNLDSPNHTDHMKYGEWQQACPASHPYKIPTITFNVVYPVTKDNGTVDWRLSSDPMGEQAGESIHGDWINGWDEVVSDTFVEKCLQAGVSCNSFLLGDGTALGAAVE